MGQQQLLLLVLGIVIVGLAVVVGIQAFSENQKKANADALVMTGMRIASEAQAWLRKPAAFGGAVSADGVRPINFSGLMLDLRMLGYPTQDPEGETYCDINGCYTVDVIGNDFIITGTSASQSGAGDNNVVCVTVSGSLTSEINTLVNPVSGTCN